MKRAPERDVRLEAMAAANLLNELRTHTDLDEDEAATVIEGETGLIEAITEALEAAETAFAHCEVIDSRIKALAARRERHKHRADRIRDLIADAMMTAGVKTLPMATATITVSDSAPSVVVIDEGEIPECFWTSKTTRTLNKRAIADAFKAGVDVPGATSENIKPRLTVRTK